MFRHALVLTTTWMLAALLVGCGGGYTKSEAELHCRSLNPVGLPGHDEAYAQCVGCFEDCGDECAVAESSPPQYFCE
jgi:hypothetical protein